MMMCRGATESIITERFSRLDFKSDLISKQANNSNSARRCNKLKTPQQKGTTSVQIDDSFVQTIEARDSQFLSHVARTEHATSDVKRVSEYARAAKQTAQTRYG